MAARATAFQRLPVLLVALAAALAPALAGCIGSASAASAKDNLGAADEAAKKWDSNARLAQIVGAEGTLGALASAFGGSSSDLGDASDDESVGDGLAEVWIYRYVASSKSMSYVVVVSKDGAILREGQEAKRAEDQPLGQWSLDSDDAVKLALAENEHLRKGLESRFFGFAVVLHQEGAGNPVWLVAGGGGDFTSGGGGSVILDAVTGKILSSEGGSGSASDYTGGYGGWNY